MLTKELVARVEKTVREETGVISLDYRICSGGEEAEEGNPGLYIEVIQKREGAEAKEESARQSLPLNQNAAVRLMDDLAAHTVRAYNLEEMVLEWCQIQLG